MLTFFIAIVCTQFITHASHEKASIFLNFNFINSSNEQAKEVFLKSKQPIFTQTKPLSLWQEIQNNKLRTTAIIFLSTWAIVQLTILKLENKLNQNSWSSWKSELELEHFFIRSNNLVEELKQKIKEKNQNNFEKSLLEIEQEKQALNFHNKLVKTINSFWLRKLFWFNNRLFQNNRERLLRLRIIKKLINQNN